MFGIPVEEYTYSASDGKRFPHKRRVENVGQIARNVTVFVVRLFDDGPDD